MLASWLALLVVQAQLIRTQRRALHRRRGKLSYVLAPAVVLPAALGELRVYHAATLTLHLVPAWNAFAVWFLSLPLS